MKKQNFELKKALKEKSRVTYIVDIKLIFSLYCTHRKLKKET